MGLLDEKLWQFLLILVEDFSTFEHFRNLNRTSERPQISTRWSQTPDKGIRTLSCKCCTQEVFDNSQFSGNIEGSQTHVLVVRIFLASFFLKGNAKI